MSQGPKKRLASLFAFLKIKPLAIYLSICFPMISWNKATNKVLDKLWHKTCRSARVAYIDANV